MTVFENGDPTVALKVGDRVYVQGTVLQVNEGYAALVELFSPTDHYSGWIRPDLLSLPGSVIVSRRDAEHCMTALRKALGVEESLTAQMVLRDLIERINAQANPRIEEPGLYRVVKAHIGEGGPWTLVRSEEGWVCLEDGAKWQWSDLHDPVEVRPGEEGD